MPAPQHELVLGVGLPLHPDGIAAGGKWTDRALDLMAFELVAVAAVRTARGHVERTARRRLGFCSADEDAHEAAVIVGIEAAALRGGGEPRAESQRCPDGTVIDVAAPGMSRTCASWFPAGRCR